MSGRLHQAPADRQEAEAGEHDADHVEWLARAPNVSVTKRSRRGDQRDRDGHVDPEDPRPPERLHHAGAEDRPEHATQAGDAAPDADRPAPRSGGKASLIIVSVSGRTRAAVAPCAARAATSAPMLGARAAATDESANPASPTVKMRRRPNRSPRPGAGQQQAGEGQQVGVDRPFQGAHVAAERAAQRGDARSSRPSCRCWS